MKLSLIFPCFNEALAVPQVLPHVLHYLKTAGMIAHQDFEVIVVDDASTDASFELLKDFSEVRVIRHTSNQGYGAALKTGIKASQFENIAYLDMDGTYRIEDVLQLHQHLLELDADMVSGNRWSSQSGMPWIRKVGNLFYRRLIGFLFQQKVVDSCSGLRIFKKSKFKELDHFSNDLSFSLSQCLFCLREGYNFIEKEILYEKRLGESKLSELKDGVRFLRTIFRFRFIKIL